MEPGVDQEAGVTHQLGGKQGATPPTAVWRAAFIGALRNSGNVRSACTAAKISRKTAYEHKKKVAIFSAAWEEALDDAVDILEATAWMRARGDPEHGVQPSDRILELLLKAHRPDVYQPKQKIEHTGPELADGTPGPIVVSLEFDHALFLDGDDEEEPRDEEQHEPPEEEEDVDG